MAADQYDPATFDPADYPDAPAGTTPTELAAWQRLKDANNCQSDLIACCAAPGLCESDLSGCCAFAGR